MKDYSDIGTFRLVVQCLNQVSHRGLPTVKIDLKNLKKKNLYVKTVYIIAYLSAIREI